MSLEAEDDPEPRASASGWLDESRGAGRARPRIIAHRGDSCHAPENTLESARAGRHAGADAWELDVQLTRDGVPVVLHDESLLRTTDVARRFDGDPRGDAGFPLARFTLDEVCTLDAGSWFLEPGGGPRTASGFGTTARIGPEALARFASGTVRVPTLAEALELTEALDWLVNVELKSFPNADPRLLDAVLAVVDSTRTADRVLISSFDHRDLARSARRRPDIPTGVLADTPLFRPDRYVRDDLGAHAYHPSSLVLGAGSEAYLRSPSPLGLRRDEIETLGRRGIPVFVYTVNDDDRDGLAAHLAEAGVDGFFSDDPAGLVRLFLDLR